MNEGVERIVITRKFLDFKKYMSPQVPTVWEQLLTYWYYKKGTKNGERVNDFVQPSLEVLAHDTGLSINTVKKCIKELQILGFVARIEERFIGETKLNTTNRYYLNENPENAINKLSELQKFRNVKRGKDSIKEDGWE